MQAVLLLSKKISGSTPSRSYSSIHIGVAIKAGSTVSGFFIALLFARHPAPVAAIKYIVPVAFPFFAPGKRPLADGTHLGG